MPLCDTDAGLVAIFSAPYIYGNYR